MHHNKGLKWLSRRLYGKKRTRDSKTQHHVCKEWEGGGCVDKSDATTYHCTMTTIYVLLKNRGKIRKKKRKVVLDEMNRGGKKRTSIKKKKKQGREEQERESCKNREQSKRPERYQSNKQSQKTVAMAGRTVT